MQWVEGQVVEGQTSDAAAARAAAGARCTARFALGRLRCAEATRASLPGRVVKMILGVWLWFGKPDLTGGHGEQSPWLCSDALAPKVPTSHGVGVALPRGQYDL